MTNFLSAGGGQLAYEVTGLTAVAEEVVAARPELMWDLIADVTRVGEWSPECVRAAWLGEPGRPQPGARFTGHNRFPDGFEYQVTCEVTEADRPRVFAWVVLDGSGAAAQVPDRAAEIIGARLDGLWANMSATLRAMKAAAESVPGSTFGGPIAVRRNSTRQPPSGDAPRGPEWVTFREEPGYSATDGGFHVRPACHGQRPGPPRQLAARPTS